MSHVNEGPIASYNSLHDGHLSSYFGSTRVRKHLQKAGLITREGRLVSEEQYRIQLARREHKRMIKDMISQAIVQKTLEVERQRQAEIKKKLEEIAKLELVKRVRASRGRRGDEEVLQFLLPLPSRGDDMRRRAKSAKGLRVPPESEEADEEFLTPTEPTGQDEAYPSDRNFDCFQHLHRRHGKSPYPKDKIEMTHWTNLDRNALEQYSDITKDLDTLPALAPYNNPNLQRQRSTSPKRRVGPKTISLARASSLHRPGSLVVLHEAKIRSLCEVSMKFLGVGTNAGPTSSVHEVSIDQQHCGGNTLTVFKGKLSDGDVFTFVSRRHLDFPFSLTIYVDGKVDSRLSTCCEYKHRRGQRLGGPHGHFVLQEVRGASACYKCQKEAAANRTKNEAESSGSDGEQKKTKIAKRTVSSSTVSSSASRKARCPGKQQAEVAITEEQVEEAISQTSSDRQQVIVRLHGEEEKHESQSTMTTTTTTKITKTEVKSEYGETVAIQASIEPKEPVGIKHSSGSEGKSTVSTRSNSSAEAKSVSSTSQKRTVVDQPTEPEPKPSVKPTEESYANDKFDEDSSSEEDEPDSRSFAVVPPTNESVSPRPPVVTIHQPQPPQIPKPLNRSHAVGGQKQQHFDNSSLLATLAQASAEEVKYEQPTTAIVKLSNKLSGYEEPSSPVQVRQPPLFQQTTSSFYQQQVEETNQASGSSSLQATPILSPTPGLTPVLSPTPGVSPLLSPTQQKRFFDPQQNVERPVSPQSQQPNRASSILKKSVSFNEVRLERQISDEEQFSPDETEQQHQQANERHNDDEDDDEDPDAIANHEAALALEDQQRASEDRTPFLSSDSIVLDINKRTLVDRQIRRLCAEILNTGRLEKIIIRESGLNDGMVQRICDALQHSSNPVRLICLNLNAISAAGIVHIVQLMHQKPSIKMLLLYGNPIGDNGLDALVDGIFGDLPDDLKNQLAAQGIELQAPDSDDQPVRLQLTHLDLGEIGISSSGAIKFAKLLERLPTLRVLNLGGNHNIGLEGWNAISKSLSGKAYPEKLCLSHCRLGNKCTDELATALRTNTGVKHIDLEGCGIGDEGGRALLEYVQTDRHNVEDIVLDDNRISKPILDRISDVLHHGDDEEEEER